LPLFGVESTSVTPLAVTSAALITVALAIAVTVAVIVSVRVCPAVKLPTVQTPVPGS
jgi:hypothetical protein